jgi:hypothetical protein
MGNTAIHVCPPTINYLLGDGADAPSVSSRGDTGTELLLPHHIDVSCYRAYAVGCPSRTAAAWLVSISVSYSHSVWSGVRLYPYACGVAVAIGSFWCHGFTVSPEIHNFILVWKTDTSTQFRTPFTPLLIDSVTEFNASACYLLLHLRDVRHLPPSDPTEMTGGAASLMSPVTPLSVLQSDSVAAAAGSTDTEVASAGSGNAGWMVVDESVLLLLRSLWSSIEPKDLVTPVNPRAIVLQLPLAQRSLQAHVYVWSGLATDRLKRCAVFACDCTGHTTSCTRGLRHRSLSPLAPPFHSQFFTRCVSFESSRQFVCLG